MTSRLDPFRKVVTPEQAKLLTERRGCCGDKLVFTNGCFDPVHAAHVRLLATARSLGTMLVVALNSDASVARQGKGPAHPFMSADDRAIVLAGLESVTFVCVFDADTPIDLIRAMKPEVLVKGGDYTADRVVGAAECAEWGGRVELLPYEPGYSSTAMLEATT